MFDLVFFVGALVAAFVAGMFANSTTLKNKLTGVPAEVQTALDNLKAKALQVQKDALAKATAAAKPVAPPPPPPPPPTPAQIATAAAVAAVTPTVVVAPANPLPPAA